MKVLPCQCVRDACFERDETRTGCAKHRKNIRKTHIDKQGKTRILNFADSGVRMRDKAKGGRMTRFHTVWLLWCLGVGVASRLSAQQFGVQEDSGQIFLRSGNSILALSKVAQGAIVSLKDRATGQEYVALGQGAALFNLTFTRTGEQSGDTVSLGARDARRMSAEAVREKGRETALLRYEDFPDWPALSVECRATAAPGDPLVRWRLRVSGPPTLVLEDSQFPAMVLVDRLGQDRSDDRALAGATEDGAYAAPGDWRVGVRRSYVQPGSLAAQFACLYDPSGGVFTATQDGVGYPKRITITRRNDGLEYSWSHQSHHALTVPYALPYDVVCTSFRGADPSLPCDWRDAADLHKRWAMTQPWCARTVAERRDIPDWVKRGCIRIQWELRDDGSPEAALAWLDRSWSKHFPDMPPFMTFFSFERNGAWVAPKYEPYYPSDEAFKAMTTRIREMGGHVCLFPSTYQWSLTCDRRPDGGFAWDDTRDFAAVGEPHAIKDRSGALVNKNLSWLRGGQSAALCRGDAWTRAFFGASVDKMAARGVDVVQLDQVVGGRWPSDDRTVCFSPDHGHPPGFGRWDADAFREQMRQLRQQSDRNYPGMVFSMESPQELFVQDFGLFDYRHARSVINVRPWDPSPRLHAPVFPYLYNEYLPVFHIPSHTEPVALILAQAVVSGEIPSCKPRQLEFPGEALIKNGDFEMSADQPSGWTVWRNQPHGPARVTLDAADVGAGQMALCLTGSEDREDVHVYQVLPLAESALQVGRSYRLRFAMKSELSGGAGAVSLAAMSHSDWQLWKELGAWTREAAPRQGWREDELAFAIPEGARALRITLRIKGKGSVWFDQVRLDERQGDGNYAEVQRSGNAVFRIMSQWAKLAAAGAGKYLMQGRMIHPPLLQAERTSQTVTASKSASLDVQCYTMQKGLAALIDHASCPVDIPAGTGPWQHKTLDITVSSGSAELHVPLSLRQKGALLFDDFELTEVGGTGENLLRNPGFEAWPDAGRLAAGWSHISEYQGKVFKGSYRREEKDVHSGTYAIRLVSPTDDDAIHVKQVLPVDGKKLAIGKRYRLSFWVKVCDVPRWRPIVVTHDLPAILHNAFRAPDGDTAVIMINVSGKTQQGRLSVQGADTEVRLEPWELRLVEQHGKRR